MLLVLTTLGPFVSQFLASDFCLTIA